MVQERELWSMPMVSFSEPYNKINIFLGLIEYELDGVLGASQLVEFLTSSTGRKNCENKYD